MLILCHLAAWYRVRPELQNDPSTGQPALFFRHPVAPGAGDDGWMKPSEAEQVKAEASKKQTGDEKQFTLEEIEKHNKPDDAWIIIDNKVYDVSSLTGPGSWHPGGTAAILTYAGKATVDCSNDYNAIHDGYANEQRDKLFIGVLSEKGVNALKEDAERAKKVQAKVKKERADFALKPYRYGFPAKIYCRRVSADADVSLYSFTAATLIKRKEISKDTRYATSCTIPCISAEQRHLRLQHLHLRAA
jgi:nitrate reductase (NAD(P)H)